jgi:hypothetical protein
MKQTLIPLSSICHCWKSRFIPSAFAALQRGIKREKERFREKPFVLLSLRREFDYDGLWDYLELIEGFCDQAAAKLSARRHAEVALDRALAKPSYGGYQWHKVEPRQWSFFHRKTTSDAIQSVFTERFTVTNGSGFDSIYFEFEVLHVRTPDVIGSELFCFIDAESEWASFLVRRGESDDVAVA